MHAGLETPGWDRWSSRVRSRFLNHAKSFEKCSSVAASLRAAAWWTFTLADLLSAPTNKSPGAAGLEDDAWE